jgi:hypothetical protein
MIDSYRLTDKVSAMCAEIVSKFVDGRKGGLLAPLEKPVSAPGASGWPRKGLPVRFAIPEMTSGSPEQSRSPHRFLARRASWSHKAMTSTSRPSPTVKPQTRGDAGRGCECGDLRRAIAGISARSRAKSISHPPATSLAPP